MLTSRCQTKNIDRTWLTNRYAHRRTVASILVIVVFLLLFAAPIYANNTWSLSGDMNFPHRYHSATLLNDGRILVAGGNIDGHSQVETELWDPGTGIWTLTGSLNTSRAWHSATLLEDGRVLVVGGSSQSDGQLDVTLDSAEIYDPSTGQWSAAASMSEPRTGPAAVRLNDGRVLVMGGLSNNLFTTSVEIYTPDTNSWQSAAPLPPPGGAPSATLLTDGRVLAVMSDGVSEIYDPANDTWVPTAPLNTPRQGETTLLDDGRVLLSGGSIVVDYVDLFPVLDCKLATEIYNPVTDKWSLAGNMVVGRTGHTTLRLPDGKVLAVGASNACGGGEQSAEIFDPKTAKWSATDSTFTHHSGPVAVLTSNGGVMLSGGSGLYEISLNSTEIFTQSGPLPLTPERAQSMHIIDLEGSAVYDPAIGYWFADVTFMVQDDFGNPANNIDVSASSMSCRTNALGQCTARYPYYISTSTPSVTLTVNNLSSSTLLGDLPALLYDSAANSDLDGDSDGTTIIVYQDGSSNPPPTPDSMYISNLNSSYTLSGNLWTPKVAAVVTDNLGNPVDGATVSGNWGDGLIGSGTCVTPSSGVCWISYSSGVDISAVPQVSFTISDISKTGLTYDAALNRDADGNSDGTTIVILAPQPSVSVHVGDLDGSASVVSKNRWMASVTIYVRDNVNTAISGVTVNGDWTGGYSGSASCITNGAGYCSISSGDIRNRKSSATFSVSSLSHWQLSYSPSDNTDPDGDSNGTSIVILKP